jgi:Peptidase family M28
VKATVLDWTPWQFALLSLAILICLCRLIACCYQPPEPLKLDAPPELFSAARAYEQLRRLLGEESPHPTGTRSDAKLTERLLRELDRLGLKATSSERWVIVSRDGQSVLNRIQNVVAVISSSHPEKRSIMLACHHDSVAAGPGASDDGTSMAAFLEVGRALQLQAPLPRPVVLLFTDGEESGLVGARDFCDNNPLREHVGIVLNFEARGTRGGSLMFETSRGNRWMIDQVGKGVRKPMTSSAYVEVYRMMPNTSDLAVFMDRGLSGLNFAYIDGVNSYHTSRDNLQSIDLRSMQHHGDNALQLVRQLLSSNIEQGMRADEDAVYTDLFARWIIMWPQSLGPWFSGFALVIMVWIAHSGRVYFQLTAGGVIKGILCWLAVLLGAVFSSWCGWWLLRAADAIPTPFPGGVDRDVWMLYLLGCMGVFAVSASIRINPGIFWIVNAVLGALSAAVLSFTFSGFSYLWLLPTAANVASGLTLWRKRFSRERLFIACILMSLVNGTVWFPVCLLLPEALGLSVAPVFGALMAMLLLPLVPTFLDLQPRRLVQIGLVVFALAFVLCVQGIRTSPFSPESPRQVNLQLIERSGLNEAHLTVQPVDGSVPSASIGQNKKLYELGMNSGQSRDYYMTPSERFAMPDITVLNWRSNGIGQNTVIACVRSRRSAPYLSIGTPQSINVTEVTVDGVRFAVPKSRWLRVRGLPDEGINVQFEWIGGPELAFTVADLTFELPVWLAQVITARDKLPGCQAYLGDTSVAIKEVTLRGP